MRVARFETRAQPAAAPSACSKARAFAGNVYWTADQVGRLRELVGVAAHPHNQPGYTVKLTTFSELGKYIAGGGEIKLAASAEFVSSPAALPKFQSVYGFTLKPEQLVTLSGGDTAATIAAKPSIATQGTVRAIWV